MTREIRIPVSGQVFGNAVLLFVFYLYLFIYHFFRTIQKLLPAQLLMDVRSFNEREKRKVARWIRLGRARIRG